MVTIDVIINLNRKLDVQNQGCVSILKEMGSTFRVNMGLFSWHKALSKMKYL